MVDWTLLINSALVNGAWLSLALVVTMVLSARLAPDMWVSDYPPDIRERYGPMSRRAARLRPFVAAVVFLTAFAVPLQGLAALQRLGMQVTFLPALVFGAIGLLVFNVFDLLILDWLLFCTIQPRVMVLPGTEGMAGYRDYHFHFVGFLKGLGFCAVLGLVVAGAWVLLRALFM